MPMAAVVYPSFFRCAGSIVNCVGTASVVPGEQSGSSAHTPTPAGSATGSVKQRRGWGVWGAQMPVWVTWRPVSTVERVGLQTGWT